VSGTEYRIENTLDYEPNSYFESDSDDHQRDDDLTLLASDSDSDSDSNSNSDADAEDEEYICGLAPIAPEAPVNAFWGTFMIVTDKYNAENGLTSHAEQGPNLGASASEDDDSDDPEEEESDSGEENSGSDNEMDMD
jgi:hypothetical protein